MMTVEDKVAAISSIADPRERLEAIAARLIDLQGEGEKLRLLRAALAFAGVDRYFPPPEFTAARRCLAQDRPGGQLCERPHAGRGLCEGHLRQFKNGKAWGAGGLNMDHPPYDPKFKKHALEYANVTNWVLQKLMETRRWPHSSGFDWTDDPLLAAPDSHGQYWWYRAGDDRVEEVPAVAGYPDMVSHWQGFGDVHRKVVAIEDEVKALRSARHTALVEAFANESSNRALADLADLDESTVYRLRRQVKDRMLAAAS